MFRAILSAAALLTLTFPWSWGADVSVIRGQVVDRVDREFASLEQLYRELHVAPELSLHEEKSAARMAAEMRALGWEVTEKVGKTGVVALLRNGAGPTLLVRCDMDGLPVREMTGLPFASKVRTKDDAGQDVWVMHACGHDAHMAAWIGTARVLSALRDHWKGTLFFIAQPAEERGAGARMMLEDGLFTRFPKPDFCLALHVNSELPAGVIGTLEGPMSANVDSVDILVQGIGGHGAQPHTTKDPIVLASQIVLALQTIDSREIHPLEPVVVTVGSIHGGTKRIARGQAISAGIPEGLMPEVKVTDEYTPVVNNDPALTRRTTELFREWFGPDRVQQRRPTMGGEDFSRYGRTADKIPISMFVVGAVDPGRLQAGEKSDEPLPSTHSPLFAPVLEPTLKTGVTAMSAAALDILSSK